MWSTGEFQGGEIILRDTVMVDVFVQTYRMYNT